MTKITQQDIDTFGVCAEPDALRGTPAENKAVFDRLAREVLAPRVNALIDAWEDYADTAPYDPAKPYRPHNKATYQGGLYQCLAACTAVAPTNSEYWLPLALPGQDGGGETTPVWLPITPGIFTSGASFEYCAFGGRVSVRGLIGNVSDAAQSLGTLPAGFRPARTVAFLAAYGSDAATQAMRVEPNGNIYASSAVGNIRFEVSYVC
jgi:hypothetical protein